MGALGVWTTTHVIVPAYQTDPAALRSALAKRARLERQGPMSGLGAFGAASGAAAGAASGASAGATVAGPYGAAIGAVIGAALSLVHKNYFNVAQSNAACAQVLGVWNKYLATQGHVAGRALGLQVMQAVMHGAVGAGLFPGNDKHASFHEGTLQCAGDGSWVDEFLGVTLQGAPVSCGAHNCMPDAVAKFQQEIASKPPQVPDAVFLVDDILLPMNANAAIPWVYDGAQNPQVHQMLYDLADAYLANVPGTTPYVEYPASGAAMPASSSALPSTSSSAPSLSAPPAIGTALTMIPESSSGAPLTLPAGAWTFAGVDAAGGWVVKDSSGELWHLSGTQLVPLASAAVGAAPAAPSTSSIWAPSGGTSVPYLPSSTPQSAPAGASAALATTPATSGSGFALVGLLLVGGYLLLQHRPGRR